MERKMSKPFQDIVEFGIERLTNNGKINAAMMRIIDTVRIMR